MIEVGTAAAAAFIILLALWVMRMKGWLGGKVSVDKGMNYERILVYWHLLKQHCTPFNCNIIKSPSNTSHITVPHGNYYRSIEQKNPYQLPIFLVFHTQSPSILQTSTTSSSIRQSSLS